MFIYDDGGRTEAGFSGDAGDCVTRAIAIATRQPYREVYDALFALGHRQVGGQANRLGVDAGSIATRQDAHDNRPWLSETARLDMGTYHADRAGLHCPSAR
jgi:hypothetical protein